MKKILVAIMLLALAFSLTPMVGIVSAGKGQDKVSFQWVGQGLPIDDPVKEADGNTIYRDCTFLGLGDLHLQIGDGGAIEDIGKDYLELVANMNWVAHSKPTTYYSVRVTETISIYDSDTVHDETTLIGTLELKALGDNRGGHGANFVGFGTGEFEGIKIQGTSTPLEIIPDATSPVGYYIQLTRTGTVMGWP